MTAIIRHIVEQHAEEAAFLWLLRDAATDAPRYDLQDLARLDERVEAHVDGLRVAGEPGWEIAHAALEQHQEAGEVFAAGVLALESQATDKIDTVCATTEAARETVRAFISALGWIEAQRLRGTVASLLHDSTPHRRMLGVAACAVHRVDPGSLLPSFLEDEPVVRARALRLVGEIGRADLREAVRTALRDPDEACRFWAAWSGGLVGERDGSIAILRTHAEGDGPFKWRALQLLLRIIPQVEAMRWLKGLNSSPAHARLVVTGAGILGDPVFVPWLIQHMEDPALARVAGESFAMITGVDLAYDDLETDPPEGFEASPTGAAADEDVGLDSDEDLPWPDPGLLRDWWNRKGGRFNHGQRYLLGRPLTSEACRHALASGFQRQRWAAALELALTGPEAPLFNWRAPARAQRTT